MRQPVLYLVPKRALAAGTPEVAPEKLGASIR